MTTAPSLSALYQTSTFYPIVAHMDTDAIRDVVNKLKANQLEDDDYEDEVDEVDDFDDCDAEEPDPITLGFVDKPKNHWSLRRQYFPSKAGGVPVLLYLRIKFFFILHDLFGYKICCVKIRPGLTLRIFHQGVHPFVTFVKNLYNFCFRYETNGLCYCLKLMAYAIV